VAEVIFRRFGARYHPDHVGRLLHQLGLSWQRPARRAQERDDKEVHRWLHQTWPAIKRGLRGVGRRSCL
jgi:transposase